MSLENVSELRFMVTGGAGFIGSHLINKLCALGCEKIVALDNLSYGTWSNLDACDTNSLTCVTADLADLSIEQMAGLLRGCNVLLHFAAEKHNNAIGSPQRVIDVNISATARLFAAAGIAGVRKVIFASSLYAYGRMNGAAMREDEPPVPCTVYGVSKLAGEGLLREAAQRYGFDGQSFRIFFVYGPRQLSGAGYPSVIVRNFRRILSGEPPLICGDGNQVLDYTFVEDVVEAVIQAAICSTGHNILNMGSGTGISIQDLTAMMLKVSGSSLRPVFGPADWTAGTSRVSDAGLIRDALGWRSKTGLQDGLTAVWNWMKSNDESRHGRM
jgi:UDP-glucose 4-epimerase